jgi:predicted aspartyl protease
MIRGAVGARLEPRFTLTFLDSADNPLLLDVEIDTGFAGLMALPTDLITHLALPFVGDFPVELADGSSTTRPCYQARVEWKGTVRSIRAMDMGTTPLVGVNFLWGHRVKIDVVVGGDVTVEPLP